MENFNKGIPITLSTDDPTLFHTDIVEEYRVLKENFGLSDDELVKIARTGFEFAFLTDGERRQMLAAFDRSIAKLLKQTYQEATDE